MRPRERSSERHRHHRRGAHGLRDLRRRAPRHFRDRPGGHRGEGRAREVQGRSEANRPGYLRQRAPDIGRRRVLRAPHRPEVRRAEGSAGAHRESTLWLWSAGNPSRRAGDPARPGGVRPCRWRGEHVDGVARFEKNGTVTAGNASGINDGAAAVVVASADAAKKAGLTPIARIVSGGVCGVDPDIMGIGPAPSSRQALQRAGLKVQDMDLVEINEAFATQYLAVEKDLGLDREKTNVNGGAIALGHPLGASGARLALTLAYELRKREKRYGLASLCIGGGQGIAAVIERVP